MNTDKEKWIDDVFTSMVGHKKQQPNTDLFEKIEQIISNPQQRIISLTQLKKVAVAASFILIFNIAAIYNNTQNTSESYDFVSVDSSSESLISNYYIYE